MNRKHDAIQRENNNFNSSIRQFLSKVGRAAVNKDHKNTLEVKAAKLIRYFGIYTYASRGINSFCAINSVLEDYPQENYPLENTPPKRELSPRILPPSKLTPWKLSLVKLLPRKQSSMRWINISLKDVN